MFDNIIHDTHYQGIPLATGQDSFHENRLSDALATVEGIMETNNRIIASCIELLVPDQSPFRMGWNTDECVTEFVKKVQHYARWKHTELHKRNPNRRKPVIDAIWQKGCTAQCKPYYRVILLLNREAYFEQSAGYDPASTFQYRARLAWAKVMQIPQHHSGAFIRFPNHGLLTVDNTADGLFQLFPKVSVLCAIPRQMHGQRLMGFGSTRRARSKRQKLAS